MDIQNLKDPHIAVISDIHGNYVALERCLDHAASNQANAYLFLGDYVSELAYPERTMRLLYETAQKYPCMFIRGNKEDYWFQFRDRGRQAGSMGTPPAALYCMHTGRSLPVILTSFPKCRLPGSCCWRDSPELRPATVPLSG